jgi:hypothetical protein
VLGHLQSITKLRRKINYCKYFDSQYDDIVIQRVPLFQILK